MARPLIFIHSAGAQDDGQGSSALLAHLRKALEPNYSIRAPTMPHSHDPHYQAWASDLACQLSSTDGSPVLVGHSLGGCAILKYVAEHDMAFRIPGLYIIAAPYAGRDRGWDLAEFRLPGDYQRRLRDASSVTFYHSVDDEVVPIDHLDHYEQDLPFAEIRRLEGYGHYFTAGADAIVHDLMMLRGTEG